MTVGITSSVDEAELREISSSPQQKNKNYFMVPFFDQLGDIVERLAIEVCSGNAPPVVERREYLPHFVACFGSSLISHSFNHNSGNNRVLSNLVLG